MPPASDNDRLFLKLLEEGDDLALARLCEAYYDTVYNSLLHFYKLIHTEEPTLIADVVTDTFLRLSREPWRYHPEKAGLGKFLLMDAEGDLKNAWEKRKRRDKNIQRSVELEAQFGNSPCGNDTPLEELIHKENESLLSRLLGELFPLKNDLALAQLILAGERKTEEYARLLQIEHLDPDFQRKEVKRNKDRIDKVIRRQLRKGGGHV